MSINSNGRFSIIPVFLCVFLVGCSGGGLSLKVNKLTCEYMENPMGIDTENPVLSWQMVSGHSDAMQRAYQVLVASSPEELSKDRGDIWDSRKVQDSASIQIHYAGQPLLSGNIYYWKVRIWDNQGNVSPWSDAAYWSMGLMRPEDWKAQWITYDYAHATSMPVFSKNFVLDKKVKHAMVYISGLGYYELSLNGKKVGDHVLDPAQTNYDRYALYATYDITDLLKKGSNSARVMLGDGWYNQDKAFGVDFSYGKPELICELKLEFTNGTREMIATDTTWEWTDGPVIAANVYAGETYDARKEIPEGSSEQWVSAKLAAVHPPALRAQMLPPIKKMKELVPVTFYQIGNHTYVYDMGQNFAGWVRLRVKEPKGTVLKMRMSEEIYPDSTLDFTSTGVEATRYEQTDTYICKGQGIEVWEPRFTYHGFRYVEISGLTEKPEEQTLTGIAVYSSVPVAGTFACSDEQINRLHRMALWTETSNLHGVPTDCPHREKCGWLGDAHARAPMTIYNFDMEAFWIKYLHDIRSSASREGVTIFHKARNQEFYQEYKKPGIPFMIAPGKRECGAASPDWGTALVQIPWYLYLYYGNAGILNEFYPDMKIWVSYLETLAKKNIITQGLGDWCPPGGPTDCPIALSSTAFYYLDLSIMEQSAKLFNKTEDELHYRTLKAAVKEAFIHAFYNKTEHSFGSQTGNAMAIDMGLVPEGEERGVADAIAKDVREHYAGFIHTGIFGLPRIFNALARYGHEDLSYSILAGKGKRSFENMWKIYGATTLWEELPVDDVPGAEKLRSHFGSHNHPMQGGFDAWFYSGIAGISPVPENPGFRTIRFEPFLTKQLQWAEASYQSKYGLVKSSWKWNNKVFEWEVVIPPDCEGNVVIPFAKYSSVQLSDKKVPVVKTDSNGEKKFRLGSGHYTIIINL